MAKLAEWKVDIQFEDLILAACKAKRHLQWLGRFFQCRPTIDHRRELRVLRCVSFRTYLANINF